jgi:hypothetical protein
MIDTDVIQALLASRGKSGLNIVDYSLHDHGDGKGVIIGQWDEAKLGPRPTDDELALVKVVKAPKVDRVKALEDRLDAIEKRLPKA